MAKQVNSHFKRAPKMSPEERRLNLLEVGVQMFAELGIDGAKHKDLAEAAKVSVPTVFKYFPTRPDLVHDVLAEVERVIAKKVVAPTQEVQNAQESLILSGQLMLEFAQNYPNHAKVWLMWSTHFEASISAQYQKFEEKIVLFASMIISQAASKQLAPDVLQDRTRMLMSSGLGLVREVLRGTQVSELKRFYQNTSHLLTT